MTLKEIVAEVTCKDNINSATPLTTEEVMEIVIKCENVYNISIDDEEYENVETPGGLRAVLYLNGVIPGDVGEL
jgi:acyl carrier protein